MSVRIDMGRVLGFVVVIHAAVVFDVPLDPVDHLCSEWYYTEWQCSQH